MLLDQKNVALYMSIGTGVVGRCFFKIISNSLIQLLGRFVEQVQVPQPIERIKIMTISKVFASAASAIALSGAVFAAALAPATPAMAGYHGKTQKADIVDTAVSAGTFKTLVAAVQAAGLEATLRSDGPFTVFAPSDEAFAKLPAGTVETLLKPENKDKLVSILTYHVVPGKIYSKSLAGKKLDAKAVQGTTVAVNGTHGVMIDNATVTAADIKTSNGVIHVIDSVLMP